jgi:site-specific recombinase XerD
MKEIKLAGHTEQGVLDLRTRVPRFFTFLTEKNVKINGVGIREAQDYQGWLIEAGRLKGGAYSPKTVNSFLIAASNFYEFVKRKNLVLSNPFKEIKKMRIDKKLPRNLLKEEQMQKFLEKLSRYDEAQTLKAKITRYRVHVIAELLYATGLRVSEAAHLRIEDINFSRGTITVREGKGGKSRTAWINDYALDVLKLYVEQMQPVVFTEWHLRNVNLFGVTWQRFGKFLNEALRSTAAELGFPAMTSHGFRHALGYHLLRAGCNIRYIQEILGHKLLRNTEIYTKVDKEDLKEVLDACHPRKFRSVQDDDETKPSNKKTHTR